jgi:hypothetical protein
VFSVPTAGGKQDLESAGASLPAGLAGLEKDAWQQAAQPASRCTRSLKPQWVFLPGGPDAPHPERVPPRPEAPQIHLNRQSCDASLIAGDPLG